MFIEYFIEEIEKQAARTSFDEARRMIQRERPGTDVRKIPRQIKDIGPYYTQGQIRLGDRPTLAETYHELGHAEQPNILSDTPRYMPQIVSTMAGLAAIPLLRRLPWHYRLAAPAIAASGFMHAPASELSATKRAVNKIKKSHPDKVEESVRGEMSPWLKAHVKEELSNPLLYASAAGTGAAALTYPGIVRVLKKLRGR